MKKVISVIIFLSLLLIPILVEAQTPTPPDVPTLGPLIICSSGDSGNLVRIKSLMNQSVYANPIQLVFVIQMMTMFEPSFNVGYRLDNSQIYSVSTSSSSTNQGTGDWYSYQTIGAGTVNLPVLSEGLHAISVYAGYQYLGTNARFEAYEYETVYFTIVDQSQLTFQSNATGIVNNTVLVGQLTTISPEGNTTYKDMLPLNCTLNLKQNATVPFASIQEVDYSIDNRSLTKLSIPNIPTGYRTFSPEAMQFSFFSAIDISSLSNGIHELEMFASGICNINNDGLTSWNSSLAPITFIVYNQPPPAITILSPLNTTYRFANITLSSIQLNCIIDKPTSWIGYTLDNQSATTIDGNTTLSDLSYGKHTLTIFANDTLGNMVQSSVVFNVTAIAPFAITPIIILAVVVATALGIGILVYSRRYRREHQTIKG